MRFLPTPAEERALELRARAKRWRRAGLIDDDGKKALETASAGPWRVFALLPRVGLFLLTMFAAGSAGMFLQIFFPLPVVMGVAFVAAAEHLIARMGFFRTGVEEALWISAVFAFIADLGRFGVSATWVAAWLVLIAGAAFLLLSLRLLHTLLFLLSIVLMAFWLADFASVAATGWAVLVLGAAALLVHVLPAERPFQASASGWVATLAPPAAWALVRFESLAGAHLIALGCAVVWIAAGIRWRSRHLLAGGALAAVAFAYELLEPRPWAIEWKLIAAGVSGLAIAIALERFLRTPRRGFTSAAVGDDDEPALLEMAAVAALSPALPRSETVDGGRFGGGGASGEY